MATPIIKVPVDDTAFQKFLTLFKKYQTALNDMPEAWKGINSGIEDHVEMGAAAVNAIEGQVKATTQLASIEDKRDASRKKRAKEQEDDDRKQEERDKRALSRRQVAIDQLKTHAQNVTSVVEGMSNWAASEQHIGGLIGGIGGAASSAGSSLGGVGGFLGGIGGPILAGIGMTLGFGAAALGGAYSIASGAADRFRSAGGLGITTGELQGTQDYLGPAFGDTAGMMDRLMMAKYSPSHQGALALLGINPTGKDAAQMLPESIVKARRFFLNQGKNMDVMAATGVLGLFSPEQLMNSTQYSEADILGKGKRSAEWAKKNGVSKSASESMVDFVSNVDAATDALKNKFVNIVSYSLPVLNNLIQKFNALAHDIAGIEPFFGKLAHMFGVVAQPAGEINKAGARAVAAGAALITNPGAVGSAAVSAIGSWAANLFGGDSNGSVADRHNNPGNIMRGGKFLTFPTLAAGFTAEARQLLIDQNKHGLSTVYDLIDDPHHGWANEWSPGNSHASTMNYIASISHALGVGTHDKINLNNLDTMKKFIVAQRAFERGGTGHGTQHRVAKHQPHVTVVVRDQGSSVSSKVNAMN